MRTVPTALRLAVPAVLVSGIGLSSAFATGLDVKASGEKTFYVNPRAGNSQITIFSQSTLEDFTTVCNRVTGQWQIDPKNLESLHGKFSLRVADMHTGIELRDRDMRGPDWFDADKYPEVTLEITKLEDIKKTEANTATFKAIGSCAMHGHTNPVAIPCTLTYLDESPLTMKLVKGDVIRIRAEFTVKLSDYGLTGPQGTQTIGVKVSDNQNIRVTVFGATEKPPAELAVDTEPATGGVPVPPPPPAP